MKLASDEETNVMSSGSQPGPAERGLDLYHITRALSPEAFRGFKERIRQYRHIFCRFHDANLEGRDNSGKGDASCPVPPRLASLLAACAPSAELSLYVHPDQGSNFISLAANSIARAAGLELSSFWANLKQHLTELSLAIPPHAENSEALDLRFLGMLTALQNLKVDCAADNWLHGRYSNIDGQHGDMPGRPLKLKLPHLASLKLRSFQRGELVLCCPRLAEVVVERAKDLRIVVEDASLVELVLLECAAVQFALYAPEDQLRNLKSLVILESTEVGRRLIQDVGHMRHLHTLQYDNLPIACIPRSLPQSLQHLSLALSGRYSKLSRGLGPDLKVTSFCNDYGGKAWDSSSAKPLAKLLTTHSMSHVQMSVLKRVVRCMTGRGLEAIRAISRGDIFAVHDPPNDNNKGRFLTVILQGRKSRQSESWYEVNRIKHFRWSLELDLSSYNEHMAGVVDV